MSKIHSKETQIEMQVFRELRKRGIYFQQHYRGVPGCPDIALPQKKIAIFIDGDFWHGYEFSRGKSRLPKKYWLDKIESNVKRDKRNRSALKRRGWRILRVWEHELKKAPARSIAKISFFLKRR